MIENEVIDFLMTELTDMNSCPRKIRRAIKEMARLAPRISLGRRMLTEQLIDVLFDLYERGLSDAVELGTALKTKLNRHARIVPVRHAGTILLLRKRSLKFAM